MVERQDVPFDLDAFQAEGEDGGKARKDFEFVFGGEKYTLPGKPNVLAIIDFDNNRIESGLRRLLGEQWPRMVASDAVLDTEKFNGLLAAYQKHLGINQGESSASPVSSRKTATRSRRTSNGTTKLR